MSRTVLALRHLAFEDLGCLEPVLAQAGWDVTYLDIGVDRLDAVDPQEADLMVVLGGPIGAYEDDRYPFLVQEIHLLERRLAGGRATLGICLGAQLIARALGARVYPARAKEIGFAPIQITAEGRASCLAPLAEGPVLHWHGDTFDLPRGATRLASTEICDNQAFAWGPRVLALQFHPEAGDDRFERWLIGHTLELSMAGIDVAALRADHAAFAPDLGRRASAWSRRWLAEAVA